MAGRNVQRSTREINPYYRGTTLHQTGSRQPTAAPEVKHASSLPTPYNRIKVGKACWIHTRQHMQLAAWLPPTLCQSVIDGEIVHCLQSYIGRHSASADWVNTLPLTALVSF